MTRTGKAVLEQRAYALMNLIENEADPQTRTAYLAYKDLAQRLSVSESCIRFSLNSLTENKWIIKCERYLPNGGQLENAYSLTPLGRENLKAHQPHQPQQVQQASAQPRLFSPVG